ncbi:hypothetical protein [Natrinema pallidum]|uniref:DUF7260 domain-containing protein n=2 Tax=Natrinema pallidum TaxID=69527 RepID=L9Z175_9EURY|nr:hypothetical protein [Natrinema pallidum]ELY78913.1 hypothetical protein C487_06795 [Natrinema pallidum DSM 3751]QCW04819.1 hypothetical protein FGF80_17035 [Natrinema pallidum]
MTGSTAVHRALDCVDEERAAVEKRDAAFEAFARRVREVPAERPAAARSQQAVAATPAMATTVQTGRSTTTGDRCVTVREAFAETVRPHSIADCEADESLTETIAAELSEDIAVALASETGWTPPLKRAVLETVETRRTEADVVQQTLRSERETLTDARDEIDDILAWLQSMADESLLQRDFETLRENHDRLATYRDRLETLTADRQAQFTRSTNRYGPGGTRYRTLVESVYSDCAVRYPLLSSATRLYGICGDCQRTVRAHLSRRV